MYKESSTALCFVVKHAGSGRVQADLLFEAAGEKLMYSLLEIIVFVFDVQT